MGNTAYTETLELAGRIIMENGGETYRVEETITRMGRALGLDHVESFAVPSGVFISYRRDGQSESAIIRVRRKGTNLSRIDRVNHVSRCVESGAMDVEAALTQLRAIEHSAPQLGAVPVAALAGVSSGAFAVMFGGNAVDCVVALVVAAAVHLLGGWLEKYRITGFMQTMIGGFFTALLPMLFHSLTAMGSTFAMIAGALMPLVPGLAFTNGIRDIANGDYLSGPVRMIDAVLVFVSIAAGVGLVIGIYNMLTGGVLI